LQTAQALQQAFVQLLGQYDYAQITIREITGVAGTSLGSFYEYFASKDDLARVCLHLRSKALLAALAQAVQDHAGQPLLKVLDAAIASQVAAHGSHPSEWAAHYLLERHLSGAEAYCKMYERFVDEWERVLRASSDLPPLPLELPLREPARVCQTVLYGLFAHAHLGSPKGRPALAPLAAQARLVLQGYLALWFSSNACPQSRPAQTS
jgi:AcrR family transcriptional regulator